MDKYTPREIEKKWQQKWEEDKVYQTEMDPEQEKYYVLEMFPYPSGNLHMGHVRNYSIGDVIARFRTMEGYNVLHPMGFDSFGMPVGQAQLGGDAPGDGGLTRSARSVDGDDNSHGWPPAGHPGRGAVTIRG